MECRAAGEDEESALLALEPCQCPASWGLPSSIAAEDQESRFRDLLHLSDGAWTSIVLRLLLHHELTRVGASTKADVELQRALEVLRQGQAVGSSDLVGRAKPALRYVLRCARGQDADDGHHDEHHGHADLALLDRRQRAAIWGLRASALRFYGCLGWQAAQDCAERAVALDLDEPAWQHSLGLHRRDCALLGAAGAAPRGSASRPVAALHLAACMLWEAARPGRGPDALGDLERVRAVARAASIASEVAAGRENCPHAQAQGALLLRLAAALSRRRGPLRQAQLAQAAARQSEACARRLLALLDKCLLAHVVVAAVWGARGRGALQREQREDVHRLYGVQADRAVEMLQEYSFGMLYVMSR